MKADKSKVTRLIKTAKGQLEGICKMIDEDRYCIDISNQLMASIAILQKANKEVLSAHLQHCLKENASQEKIDELQEVLAKLAR